MVAKTMRHWNNHQLVVIDVETTGLRPFWHEVVQFAAIALNADLEPRKDIMPFDIYLCPEHPERADPEALKVSKLDLKTLICTGHNPDKARDMFQLWVDRLELGMTPSGIPKRIMPLAHGWPFDKPFVQDWLTYGLYEELFDARYRDTMCTSLFLNDHAAMHAERVPYSKNNLAWLASKLGVEHDNAHDALSDCLVTAECYRRLCHIGIIA